MVVNCHVNYTRGNGRPPLLNTSVWNMEYSGIRRILVHDRMQFRLFKRTHLNLDMWQVPYRILADLLVTLELAFSSSFDDNEGCLLPLSLSLSLYPIFIFLTNTFRKLVFICLSREVFFILFSNSHNLFDVSCFIMFNNFKLLKFIILSCR